MPLTIPDSFPASLLRAALEGMSVPELAAAAGLPARCIRQRLRAAAAVALHRAGSSQGQGVLRTALGRFLSAREVAGCARVAAVLERQGRRGAHQSGASYAA
jgi:hypothetical protein